MVEAGPWEIFDEASLVECYDQSVAFVYRYASRLTGNDRPRTDDLVQEVYLHLVRAARAGTVSTVGIGWLVTSVRHRFLDRLRGDQREERRLRLAWSAPDHGQGDDGTDPPDFSRLSDRERMALMLRYIDDLPVIEVAAVMGDSVHATESLLARARRRIRTQEVRDA
jgi:RNA polymerase sigma-70 factor (ECF subfamily)